MLCLRQHCILLFVVLEPRWEFYYLTTSCAVCPAALHTVICRTIASLGVLLLLHYQLCCVSDSADSPVLWLRLDPELSMMRSVAVHQPDNQWQYQLRHERDVTAQTDAISALHAMARHGTADIPRNWYIEYICTLCTVYWDPVKVPIP